MAPVTTTSNTFSALETGSSFAIFLFGIVTLQTYLYYSRFHEDRLVVKVLVRSTHLPVLSSGTKLHKLARFGAWNWATQLEFLMRFTERRLLSMCGLIACLPCLVSASPSYLEDGLPCLSRYEIHIQTHILVFLIAVPILYLSISELL